MFLGLSTRITAQCFQIESILVDACGLPEGENEMVRFAIGSTDLSTSDLTVSWATTANNWLGVCQSASTAQTTAQLNATITTCGYLKEPVNGVLPANSKVLLITSTNIDVNANSFDGLNDTLYVIYQCAGNTAGHFGNYNSSSSTRTLTMNFAGGCTDVVSYDRSLLVNQNGIPGEPSALRDGGVVDYTPNGTPTYNNYGCQAPITATSISITGTPTTICPQDTVALTATASNNNVIWWGGAGTFSAQNTTSVSYYSSNTDNFPLWIYAGIVIPCGDTIKDSIQITQSTSSNLSVTASANSICEGDVITLTATGANALIWFDGTTNSTTTIDTSGTFYAYTTACGIDSSGVTITWNGVPPTVTLSGDSTICQGETTVITATGDAPFTWHDNTTGTTFSATNSGLIYATASNTCGSDTAFMNITITGTPPTAQITGDTTICDNTPTTLTASGGDSYLWQDGSTSTTLSSLAQSGYVIVSNGCGSDTAHFNIIDLGTSPSVSLSGDSTICQGETTIITASGNAPFTWQDNSTGNTFSATNGGLIFATANNACGSDTAFMNIIITGTLPTAQISGDTIICDNTPTLLTASGGDNYLWQDGTTATSYSTLTQNGYVIVSNGCGSDTAYFNVVDMGNSPSASIMGNVNICTNKISTFTASGGDTYVWSDESTSSSFSTNQANPIYVIAINQCGQDTAYLNLIDQSVTADFEMSDSVGYQPLIIDFTNYSNNANQYVWDFGNGVTSTNEDEEQTYTQQGLYTVQLIAANAFCTDTAISLINILDNANVFIPNSFSPNGDGLNDSFVPVLTSISTENFSFMIFNRNGEIIFNTSQPGEAWYGNYLGQPVPVDTYVWKIIYREAGSSVKIEKYGHVNLIR